MKLSELETEQIENLTVEQLARIVYDGVCDDGKDADVALLLGSRPQWCHERAVAAAELYFAGRVRYIMPSGGVAWDVDGVSLTEAEYMRSVLLSLGVPDEAILLENEATTTKENMLYGTIQINRRFRLENAKRICIVTSAGHMRRSMALARWLLPRSAELSSYPAGIPENPVAFLRANGTTKALRCVKLLRELIGHGLIEDIEY